MNCGFSLHILLTVAGLAAATLDGFKAELARYWFTVYRRKGAPDTSGFEHVFVGEVRGNAPTDNTDGFHNWIQLAKEEQAGRTEYQKWKGQNEVRLYFVIQLISAAKFSIDKIVFSCVTA